jgi:NAD(P)-dependent dehydrogenase (short-subunit alcohol dehydrogenase family)
MRDRTAGFAGKTFVLTGATAGIGKAIARQAADAGAKIILVARGEEKLAETAAELPAGSCVKLIAGCVTQVETAQSAFEAAETLGGCDVLINNAGIFPTALLSDMEPNLAEQVMQVNFFGTFHFCRTFLPAMIARGSGSVVNITSIAARVPTPGLSVYAASKGAVEAFTRAIAAEAAPRVRVNCLSPGPTRTETVVALEAVDDTGAVAEVTKAIPLARYAECDEIADGVMFLAGHGSSWMTGQTLQVNGGVLMA